MKGPLNLDSKSFTTLQRGENTIIHGAWPHFFLTFKMADQQHVRYRNFFEDFFADENNEELDEEEEEEVLHNLMLPGDARDINQAPTNRDFEADLDDGWSSEGGDQTLNMPFEGDSRLHAGAEFPDLPSPLDFFKLFISDELIDLLVQETNNYAQQKIDRGNLKPHSR